MSEETGFGRDIGLKKVRDEGKAYKVTQRPPTLEEAVSLYNRRNPNNPMDFEEVERVHRMICSMLGGAPATEDNGDGSFTHAWTPVRRKW